jgi:hypothetical protein
MMPTLLSFDPEFTLLFPPGEIDLLAQFTSDKRAAVSNGDFSQNSRVTTKSQLGANRVQSTNSVKRAIRKNLNKNRKTAQVRGLSNIALVPKGILGTVHAYLPINT